MWYVYQGEWMNWYKLSVAQANEIIALNKKGDLVTSLEDYSEEDDKEVAVNFENVVGQDSLTRFDSKKPKRKRNHKKIITEGENQNLMQRTNSFLLALLCLMIFLVTQIGFLIPIIHFLEFGLKRMFKSLGIILKIQFQNTIFS